MSDKNNKDISTLYKYLSKYKHFFFWGTVVLICTNAAAFVIPWAIRIGVDAITDVSEGGRLLSYLKPEVKSLLPFLALVIIVIAAVGGLMRFFARRTIIWASRHIEYDLRNDLFSHLLRLPATYYQKTATGDIIAHLSNDLEAVRMLAGPAIMYMLNTVIVTIFAFTLMLSISWKLTLYVLIPLPLLSILMLFIGQQIHRRFMKIQEHFSKISTFVQENLSGVRVIKAYRRQKYQNDKFENINKKYVGLNMSLAKIRSIFMPGIYFLAGMTLVTLLWAGGGEVINGNISIGTFFAFKIYLSMLIWPMLAIGWVISLYQRGTASLSRIDKIFAEKPESSILSAPITVRGKGDIEFRDLTFSYNSGDEQVLQNISFDIKAGESVAIVGATGTGKTTLISLLVRKFTVPDSSLFIDGVDVNQIPLDELRSRIGIVPQESYLFSDTIANNLAFSASETDMTKVMEASRQAAFANEVEDFKYGYDTILGERGITLSGGQKQRASIARALFKRPEILIFDDSFSNVDTQTEEMILANLERVIGKVTLILISHRVSTIKRADKIVVLDNNTIIEIGSHDELIAKQGRYYQIIQRELLARELENLA